MYIFIAVFLIVLVTLFKGLKHVGLEFDTTSCYVIAFGFALVIASIGWWFIARIPIDEKANRRFHFATVEKVFAVLMVITACSMAFAHGSNDVANAIGPVAAVVSIAQEGIIAEKSSISIWILILGGFGIVVGVRDLWPESYNDRWQPHYSIDPHSRVFGRGCSSRYDRVGVRHRNPNFYHPHVGRSRTRRRHG